MRRAVKRVVSAEIEDNCNGHECGNAEALRTNLLSLTAPCFLVRLKASMQTRRVSDDGQTIIDGTVLLLLYTAISGYGKPQVY